MKVSQIFFIGMVSLIGVVGVGSAHADDEDATAAPAKKTAHKTSKKKVKAKGSAKREKETEGTEAPNRFEADTVIKSQYQQDGKQLEVDPD
jgi:hypothetical protein